MKKFYLICIVAFFSLSLLAQPCSNLFFSEYVEGSSNNKALEIFNPTSVPVDLAGYRVLLFANGATTPTNTLNLSGTVNAGDVYVIVNASANDSIKVHRDTTSSVTNFNGDDAVVLLSGTDTLDIIGIVGNDPGTFWTVDSGTTIDHTLVRKETVQGGTTNWALSSTQWYVFPRDTIRLGAHTMNACGAVADTLVRFFPNAATITESAGTYDINIVLNAASVSDTFSIDLELVGGTGDASDIDNFATQTVVFLPNTLTAQLTITITDDTIQEPTETLVFRLVNPVGGILIGSDSVFTLSIAASDVPLQTVTISQITSLNATFQPDSLGKAVLVTGTVYGINNRSTGLQFTIHDGTDGIQVFSPSANFGYTVTETDSVVVSGVVGFFSGMTQLIQLDTVYKIGTGVLKSPVVTPDLDESTESELVRINNVTLVNPSQWDTTGNAAGFNCDVTDGVGTWTLRIDEQTNIFKTNMPAPTGRFDVIGLGGQFDASSPYNSGYQLLPRYIQDIVIIISTNDLATDLFRVFPNPGKDYFNVLLQNFEKTTTLRLLDVTGRIIQTQLANSNIATLNVSGLSQGMYLLQVESGDNVSYQKVYIQR